MILVTGGAGYIGSHTCVALIRAGYTPVILDNFCNSQPEVLARLQRITGQPITCITGDVRDRSVLDGVFSRYPITAVMHFAGLKSVGESVAYPLRYIDSNVKGALVLLQAMQHAAVKTLVFSSSATVYGEPQTLPIPESHPCAVTNPYGRSKLMIEDMLRDVYAADAQYRVAALRYFNPVGAHPSGLMGEDPRGEPNNLMPYLAQVAVGRLPHLQVFGADYDTPDGSGVRDYVHVQDLAEGHLKALTVLLSAPQGQHLTLNLGTGVGYSVLEMRAAFARVSQKAIPHVIAPRRPGDAAVSYADTTLANAVLGWRATRTLDEMCADTWHWQQQNPNGYVADPGTAPHHSETEI